jgi:class 3 adenylate cyclase
MQYRGVGKWGLKLPEISLGLWHNFGGTGRSSGRARSSAARSSSGSRTSTSRTTTARPRDSGGFDGEDVIACPRCGQENPDGFRFCGACGAELTAEPGSAGEVRKVVTVVFCDLAGYTSRGEGLDPEALRRL